MFTILLIIIYLAFISLGLPDGLLGSAWPAMYTSLNIPLHFAGYISMIIAAGTVISSILSSQVIRGFGTGRVTVISVLMTAGALTGFSFAHNYIVVCLCAFPLGIGAGCVDAALNNYVALHYKAHHMNWLHCSWGIGASIGPFIMSSFLMNGSLWNSGYRMVAVLQFGLVIILAVTLPLWGKNERGAVEHTSDAKPAHLSELFRIAGVKQALITFYCYCTLEVIIGLWGSSYLVIIRNIPHEIAAQWIAFYYTGITFGRFVSGFLSTKFSNRHMVRLGQALIACGITALAVPLGTSLVLPGFFIIGLGCAPIYPALLHETPNNFGVKYSQAIMGIQMASAYIGTTLMPLLFGRLASFTSFAIFPFFIACVLIIKIVSSEWLFRRVAASRLVHFH
jgi:fucose permease